MNSILCMKTNLLILSAFGPLPGIHSAAEATEFAVVELACLFVIVLLLRRVWRRYTPKGFAFFWLAMVGLGLACLTGAFATAPSSARRITVDGYCHDVREVYFGRSNPQYVFQLTLNTGSTLRLQTPLTPSWFSGIEDGTLLRVTYLDETRPVFEFPRAIALTVLSGDHIGWHGSVDANWLGAWLLFPLGIAGCFASVVCWLRNRRLDLSQTSSDDDDGRNLDDGQNLNLTDLKLR